MTNFWSLEPEVAGALGDGTKIDTSIHPPRVRTLEYVFMGWLGDDLLEAFPCYIVSEILGDALVFARLTGFQLDGVEVVISEAFAEMYPARCIPNFRWLKVTGTVGIDDFGLSDDHRLVVSDAALRLLQQRTLSHCDVEPYSV